MGLPRQAIRLRTCKHTLVEAIWDNRGLSGAFWLRQRRVAANPGRPGIPVPPSLAGYKERVRKAAELIKGNDVTVTSLDYKEVARPTRAGRHRLY